MIDIEQQVHYIIQKMLVALSEWQAGVPVDYNTVKKEGRAKLVKLIEDREKEIAKAFGGCTNCYGKGYSSYMNGITAYADFGDELGGKAFVHHDVHETKYCECDRGKQLKIRDETRNK